MLSGGAKMPRPRFLRLALPGGAKIPPGPSALRDRSHAAATRFESSAIYPCASYRENTAGGPIAYLWCGPRAPTPAEFLALVPGRGLGHVRVRLPAPPDHPPTEVPPGHRHGERRGDRDTVALGCPRREGDPEPGDGTLRRPDLGAFPDHDGPPASCRRREGRRPAARRPRRAHGINRRRHGAAPAPRAPGPEPAARPVRRVHGMPHPTVTSGSGTGV